MTTLVASDFLSLLLEHYIYTVVVPSLCHSFHCAKPLRKRARQYPEARQQVADVEFFALRWLRQHWQFNIT